MHLPSTRIEAREGDATPSNPPSFNYAIAAVVGIGAALIIILIISWKYLKRYRITHDTPPKYLPPFLKNSWTNWRVKKPPPYRRSNGEHLESISESASLSSQSARQSRQSTAFVNGSSGAGVDRNTSVRSVMTLPAYNPKAGDTEQVLGREGERAGIDTVVQFPDIAEQEEEERRDEEMEALYQVRLARRQEATDREERRRLRRAARAGDSSALEELRRLRTASSGAASSERTIEELREEHQRVRERQRAVSTVAYGDIGVARHDGTRIQTNSEEDERPLLGDAASIAASSRHRRDHSASSVVSLDSLNSDLPSPGFRRQSGTARAESPLRRASGQGQMSSPEIIDADRDLASDGVPGHSPPDYENIELEDAREPPPDYSSPVEARGRTLSQSHPRELETETQRHSPDASHPPNLRVGTVPSIVVVTPSPLSPRRTDESLG